MSLINFSQLSFSKFKNFNNSPYYSSYIRNETDEKDVKFATEITQLNKFCGGIQSLSKFVKTEEDQLKAGFSIPLEENKFLLKLDDDIQKYTKSDDFRDKVSKVFDLEKYELITRSIITKSKNTKYKPYLKTNFRLKYNSDKEVSMSSRFFKFKNLEKAQYNDDSDDEEGYMRLNCENISDLRGALSYNSKTRFIANIKLKKVTITKKEDSFIIAKFNFEIDQILYQLREKQELSSLPIFIKRRLNK